ncbi:unnamed protein product [Rhizophagus irregularis]|nr:unnamed protein product [Rhizophagus irregularis]
MINRIKKLIRCWNPSGTVLNEFCNILIVAILLGTLCGRDPQFEKSKLLSDLIHPLYASYHQNQLSR